MLTCVLASATVSAAPVQQKKFSFGVIGQTGNEGVSVEMLREALDSAAHERLAFLLVSGLKSVDEPCTDELYLERHALLERHRQNLIVSFAGSDWTECRRDDGQSAAVDRLMRLREIFSGDQAEDAQSHSQLQISRQSGRAQFRNYVENAQWKIGSVSFASINLPGGNNHYRSEAGRNSEFEDRLIANRAWLSSVFTNAARSRQRAIVLFCDGDPRLFATTQKIGRDGKRDGYFEFRRQLRELAAGFNGRVLLVHNQADTRTQAELRWRGNVGVLVLQNGWRRVTVEPSKPAIFSLEEKSLAKVRRQTSTTANPGK